MVSLCDLELTAFLETRKNSFSRRISIKDKTAFISVAVFAEHIFVNDHQLFDEAGEGAQRRTGRKIEGKIQRRKNRENRRVNTHTQTQKKSQNHAAK